MKRSIMYERSSLSNSQPRGLEAVELSERSLMSLGLEVEAYVLEYNESVAALTLKK